MRDILRQYKDPVSHLTFTKLAFIDDSYLKSFLLQWLPNRDFLFVIPPPLINWNFTLRKAFSSPFILFVLIWTHAFFHGL